MIAEPDFTLAVREALEQRGRTLVQIQGRSMYPILRNGVCVEVQPTTYDELEPGDLVVFCDRRGLVCHRLLRKANRLCYLKGDTNLRADPPVVWSQVLGRVTHVLDSASESHPIDTPFHRRHAAMRARFAYFYALYFTVLHALGHCRWWAKERQEVRSHREGN